MKRCTRSYAKLEIRSVRNSLSNDELVISHTFLNATNSQRSKTSGARFLAEYAYVCVCVRLNMFAYFESLGRVVRKLALRVSSVALCSFYSSSYGFPGLATGAYSDLYISLYKYRNINTTQQG